MQNSNWGTNNTNENQQESNEQGIYRRDYYRNYAVTLTVLGNIVIYILPILPAYLAYVVFSEWDADGAFIGALVAYAVTAFVLWLIIGYITKVFDILSMMGENLEELAALRMEEKNNE